ncbi:MAG: GDP-L-fucose synthase [Rhodocyclaceae bacterium]|nr:GDP-L-fucose synthase [Rhodocyclaceae bacterium]
MSDKKKGIVLLTGGRGLVGKNILEHAAAAKWKIIAPSSAELDLRDYQTTLDYVRHIRPDFVVHAAGKVGGIQANIAAPVEFLVTNIDLGRNIVMAAREAGVRRFLNLGSSCMYPRAAHNPLREESILTGELEPTNEGYALAKIVVERLCQYIHRENPGYEYKSMLPCNLYGRYDKFDPAHSHLIPAVIHKIHCAKMNNDKVVEIWGDGQARREFMYAGDLADAVMHALDTFDQLPDILNIGLGEDFSINEYYSEIAAIVGWSGSFSHDLSKPVGMYRKVVSVERQSRWGWRPKFSLREGLEATYSYYRSEMN